MRLATRADGVDIGSSHDVTIRNSVLDMSDDQVCVRAGQGHAAAIQSGQAPPGRGRCGTHSILVEDSETRNGHGLSLGSDGVGGVVNVTFRNIFVNGNGPQGVRSRCRLARAALLDWNLPRERAFHHNTETRIGMCDRVWGGKGFTGPREGR